MNIIKKIVNLASPSMMPIVMEVGALSASTTFQLYHQLSEEGKCIRYYCFEPDKEIYNDIVNSHPDMTSKIHISQQAFIGSYQNVAVMADNTIDMFCEANDIPYISLLIINQHISWDDFYFGGKYTFGKARYVCIGEKAELVKERFEENEKYEKVYDKEYTIFANKKLTKRKQEK